jgi:4-hydroxy-3-methylbut-2-enyl diphosphate reductase
LVEVSERAGCPALLVEGGREIPPHLLRDARRVGLTAGASAPEELVEAVIRAVEGLGSVTVSERTVAEEDIRFKLPREVRPTR